MVSGVCSERCMSGEGPKYSLQKNRPLCSITKFKSGQFGTNSIMTINVLKVYTINTMKTTMFPKCPLCLI